MSLFVKTATEAWLSSINEVLVAGETAKPRGKETKEILNQILKFDMNHPVCYHPERKLSYKFMAAEAYWITSGSPLVEDIAPYNSHITQFSDDGYIFNGAYGPAFISQLEYVVRALREDLWTRQAVISIWHPNPIKSKDQKCTLTFVFNIRHNKLHTTVLMRSNDLQLGRPYDMFNFTIMTLRVLTKFNELISECPVELGECTLHAVSSHIYEDWYGKSILMNTSTPNLNYHRMPNRCLTDWQYVVDSLLACRDMTDTTGLWEIRENENRNS